MKTFKASTITIFSIATIVAVMWSTASAATLISSALNEDQTNVPATTGRLGTLMDEGQFGTATLDTAPEIGGVTTTIIATDNTDPRTVTFRAISVANGMDVTYSVSFEAFRYDASSNTDVGVVENHRNSAYAVDSNLAGFTNEQDRDVTQVYTDATNLGDVEFFRVSINQLGSTGATDFSLDGATAVGVAYLTGISIYDSFVLGSTGTLRGAGTGDGSSEDNAINLNAPVSSFAFVATAANDELVSQENRFQGIAVQFSSIPEPGSMMLLGMGAVLTLLRRRRC